MIDKLEPDSLGDRSADRGIGATIDLLNGGDLDTIVLHVVKDDPFASISEIRQRIITASASDEVGWWRVFGVLRRHGLLRRRSRFRYARGRR